MFTRADRVLAHSKGRGSLPPLSKRLDILPFKKIMKPVHEETKNCNRCGYGSNNCVLRTVRLRPADKVYR